MRRLAAIVLVAVAAACSQETSGTSSPGCQLSGGRCVMGPSATDASCAAQYGTWSPAGCPGENRVGTCATETAVTSYYEPYYSPYYAQYVCSGVSGTWIPVPATISTPPDGGGTVGTTASCEVSSMGICWDVTDVQGSETLASIESVCPQVSGSYATAPCSTSGKVSGYCDVSNPGASAIQRLLYSSSAYTLSTAVAECADEGGVWVN